MRKYVEEIYKLVDSIEQLSDKTTIFFRVNSTNNNLNKYDFKILEFYEQILQNILMLSKESGIPQLDKLDDKYFNENINASQILEDYLTQLLHYSNFDKEFSSRTIILIETLLHNFEINKDNKFKYIYELRKFIL